MQRTHSLTFRLLLLFSFLSSPALLFVGCMSTCNSTEKEEDLSKLIPPPKSEVLLAKGKASYQQLCATCHGKTGAGDGAAGKAMLVRPTNFLKGPWRHGGTLKDAFRIITKGSPNTMLMVSWKHLPLQERWALAYYVKSLQKPSSSQ